MTNDPGASPFFSLLQSRRLTPETFDAAVNEAENAIVFMWGHDCPNCEIAKKLLSAHASEVKSKAYTWFDVNVYDHGDLGTRFGLFGIPVFLFFKKGKPIGRITSFPGLDPFLETLDRVLQKPAP